jgi:glycosyltransferase involved in cell wall biosynthesis
MHVTFYLKHFPAKGAPVNDGTSTAVDGLASGLVENGVPVTVLCEGATRSSARTRHGYDVECFANRKPYRTFALAPDLEQYVAKRVAPRRGVCLLNGMFHPSVYAMGRCLRRSGVPYVMVPHDPYDPVVFRRNPHLKWPYWFLFERRLLRGASAIQVLDDAHAGWLPGLGVDNPVISTENGIAPATVPAEPELSWRAVEEPARLMFLGRIDAYNKGLDTLLEAFESVSVLADVRLTLQGPDWGDRARLERRAANGPGAQWVRFLDPDYRRNSPKLIADHDVFCLPSRFEGFGLAALEAMLAGRVLLVSARAGIARHVRASECGVAVEPTAAAVAGGILELLRQKAQWREMGMAGRRYALANLQWKRIAADALAHYEGLVS